jgi:hypothetical protein
MDQQSSDSADGSGEPLYSIHPELHCIGTGEKRKQMMLFKKSREVVRSATESVQVKLALASCSVVGMILAAGAGSQWN